MANGITIYPIYYGSWTSNQTEIVSDFVSNLGISDFVSNLGTSNWYKPLLKYYSTDKPPQYVKNIVKLGPSVVDRYSRGKHIDSDEMSQLITDAIKKGDLPADNDGYSIHRSFPSVYSILTSIDVSSSIGKSDNQFCKGYCGFHTTVGYQDSSLKWLFSGVPPSNCGGCMPPFNYNSKKSPNGDVGVDAMLKAFAHEIAEAVTNPYSDAWMLSNGVENADICNNYFGTVYGDEVAYNVKIGSKYYLIQGNYEIENHTCTQGPDIPGLNIAVTLGSSKISKGKSGLIQQFRWSAIIQSKFYHF